MDMNLARVSQSAIERAVLESGLCLTAEQARIITEVECACLSERKRVSFGESAAVRIAREFGSSPFMLGENDAGIVAQLTEAFYDLRDDCPAVITDAELLESLGEAFDANAAGDVGLAAALARESLARQLGSPEYEIVVDDGNVYRWDPAEWRDDVTADGWYGERWGDADA